VSTSPGLSPTLATASRKLRIERFEYSVETDAIDQHINRHFLHVALLVFGLPTICA
jgi:hypothetical protein